jgi:hypothetical protein
VAEPSTAPAPAAAPGRDPQRRVSGYTLVLPPGWHHIPLRQDTDEAIKTAVDAAARYAPPDMPRDKLTGYRLEQIRRLAKLAREARRKHGTDLYVPMGLVHGIPVPGSFLVSEVSLGSVEEIPPEVMIAGLAGDGDSRKITVAGAPAARTEHTEGPGNPPEVEYASRRVDYVIAVPGDPDRYLAVAFSTFGGGNPDDELARMLVELFDAMLTTLRWTWS